MKKLCLWSAVPVALILLGETYQVWDNLGSYTVTFYSVSTLLTVVSVVTSQISFWTISLALLALMYRPVSKMYHAETDREMRENTRRSRIAAEEMLRLQLEKDEKVAEQRRLQHEKRLFTFHITSIEDMEKLGTPFLENPVEGKKLKGAEMKSWAEVKNEIDFSKLSPIDFSPSPVLFITRGMPGIGKSTFMLYSVDALLGNESSAFEKVVFLDPFQCDDWTEELRDENPARTLLAIDALRRGRHNSQEYQHLCSRVMDLVSGEARTSDERLGPFSVVATLREDEYTSLSKQRKFRDVVDSISVNHCQITPDKLDLRKILDKYLSVYEVPFEVTTKDEPDVLSQLANKSRGLPYYLRHLIADLKESAQPFSGNALKDYPTGMSSLIWQTISTRYYIADDKAIPFLLLLMYHTDVSYSRPFVNLVIDSIATEAGRESVRTKIGNMQQISFRSYMRRTDISESLEMYALDSHWRESIAVAMQDLSAIEDRFHAPARAYRDINDADFERLKKQIADRIQKRLRDGLIDTADAFVCVDMARMGESFLELATESYVSMCDLSGLDPAYKRYVQMELYRQWVTLAAKYKTMGRDYRKQVVKCYEAAFDKLQVKDFPKHLSGFAYFLQKRVLGRYDERTPDYVSLRNRIEKLHLEVIELQEQLGEKDPISYQTLALFYKNVSEYDKADAAFLKSLEVDPDFGATLQAYALFLASRGTAVRHADEGANRDAAEEYFVRATEHFEKARARIIELRAGNEELSAEQQLHEMEVLNAYAKFLTEQAGRAWDRKDRTAVIELNTAADEMYREALARYPDHEHSISGYTSFISKFGWTLPKYQDAKNLEEAERLLREYIDRCTERGAPRNPRALHILATLLYKTKPGITREPPEFSAAEKLLMESAETSDRRHNAIAYNTLAGMYMIWADKLEKDKDRSGKIDKLNLAEKALKKAIDLTNQPQHYKHLRMAHANFAKYWRMRGNRAEAAKHRDRCNNFK